MGVRKSIVITKNEITGCHEVISHYTSCGYPVITINRKHIFVHRHYYKLHKGEIPSGMVVRHSCDNPSCVNPEHLVLGTHADNVADRVARKRSAVAEKNGRAKLTAEQVKSIFTDNRSQVTLATLYNVDPKAIYNIKNRKGWKTITETL